MQPNQGHSTICPRVPESQSPKPPHCRLGSRPRLLHRWPGTGLEVCTQVRGLEDGDSRIKMQYLLLNQRYPPLPNIAHLVHNRGISGLPCFPTRLSSSHSLEVARDYWLLARGALGYWACLGQRADTDAGTPKRRPMHKSSTSILGTYLAKSSVPVGYAGTAAHHGSFAPTLFATTLPWSRTGVFE